MKPVRTTLAHPTGYVCATCGAEHEFPMYVLSNWFMTITHHCNHCYAVHYLWRGVAKLKIKGKLPQ